MTTLPHHIKLDVCRERPRYRQGRKLTAVKVYTVADESQYLLLQGVPSLNILDELRLRCSLFGHVAALSVLPDYPCEEFTSTYLLKYSAISAARVAKRRLDELEFYGGVLHVCYAPEYETVEETRMKLQDRRKTIAHRCNLLEKESQTDLKQKLSSGETHTHHLKQQERKVPHSSTLPPTNTVPAKHNTIPSDVEEVTLPGIDRISVDNINHVKQVPPLPPTVDNSLYKRQKPVHSAAQAATWSSATFQTHDTTTHARKRKLPEGEQDVYGPTFVPPPYKGPSKSLEIPATNVSQTQGVGYEQPDLSKQPRVIVKQSFSERKTAASRFIPRQIQQSKAKE